MPTILIVDDELSIATLLRDILQDEGYAVILAQNGQDAQNVLKTTRPALVVTDVMMPLVDGITLCRAIQADPVYEAIPVILMSAVVSHAVSGCRAIAFLKKPFDLQNVVDTITNVIGRADHT
jgi:two-component system response regulator VicR